MIGRWEDEADVCASSRLAVGKKMLGEDLRLAINHNCLDVLHPTSLVPLYPTST